MNTGVTTNKNTLGLITFVLALGALWSVRTLMADTQQANRRSRLVAQMTLLIISVVVLKLAGSATSIACFGIGAVLILGSRLPSISRSPAAVHALVFALVSAGALTMLLGLEGIVAQALGRETNLTGRTDIWNAVIPMAPNQFFGAGFESFWIGLDVKELARRMPNWFHPEGLNSSHNGYIEAYLNLGWIGLCLLAAILINGYRLACAAFRYDPEVGSLSLAFIAAGAVYSVSEAGFRMLTPTWIMVLTAVVAASTIVSRFAARPAHEPVRADSPRAAVQPAPPANVITWRSPERRNQPVSPVNRTRSAARVR